MSAPIVYGPAFSSYVRTVRMTLHEKGVEHELRTIDRSTEEYRAHYHPFGKVPTFEHDGLRLYETSAICRYVDEAFEGPSLQPGGALEHARLQQVIGIVDAYLYPRAVLGILIPRLLVPMHGGKTDEDKVAGSVPGTQEALGALEEILGDNQFFTGGKISLADLHVLPIIEGLNFVPERAAVFEHARGVAAWAAGMGQRPSAEATRPKL